MPTWKLYCHIQKFKIFLIILPRFSINQWFFELWRKIRSFIIWLYCYISRPVNWLRLRNIERVENFTALKQPLSPRGMKNSHRFLDLLRNFIYKRFGLKINNAGLVRQYLWANAKIVKVYFLKLAQASFYDIYFIRALFSA